MLTFIKKMGILSKVDKYEFDIDWFVFWISFAICYYLGNNHWVIAFLLTLYGISDEIKLDEKTE